MFPRNLSYFRFGATTGANVPDDLSAALSMHVLRPIGDLEAIKHGFASPLGPDDPSMVRRIGQCSLITYACEEKVLPSAAVAREVNARVKSEAARTGSAVGGKARRRIKDEVVQSMLGRAFVKPSRIVAWIDHPGGWFVVDTSSLKKAETVLSLFRQALGSFPALPPAPDHLPSVVMTEWLTHGRLTDSLSLGNECTLKDPSSSSGTIWRGSNADLSSDEVREHLRAGAQVSRLGLVFKDRLSFVLGDDLVIRKLKFLDLVMDDFDKSREASTASDRSDVVAEIDATFTIASEEVGQLLAHLSEVFGFTAVA